MEKKLEKLPKICADGHFSNFKQFVIVRSCQSTANENHFDVSQCCWKNVVFIDEKVVFFVSFHAAESKVNLCQGSCPSSGVFECDWM